MGLLDVDVSRMPTIEDIVIVEGQAEDESDKASVDQ